MDKKGKMPNHALRLKKSRRVSAALQVVDAIDSALQQGTLKVGDKLPNEQELAEMLGVGRSSVREGIRILDAYGLVEVKQGKGTFFSNQFSLKVFELMGFTPLADNYQSIINCRRIIETGCAYVACADNKVTDAVCNELEALATAMDATKGGTHSMKLERKFHQKIVEMSGNPVITKYYEMAMDVMGTYWSLLLFRPEVISSGCKSHYRIIQKLRERNGAEAAYELSQHVSIIDISTPEDSIHKIEIT